MKQDSEIKQCADRHLETKSIVPGKFQERQQQVEDAGRWRRSSYESCVGEFLTPSKGYNAGVVAMCQSAGVPE